MHNVAALFITARQQQQGRDKASAATVAPLQWDQPTAAQLFPPTTTNTTNRSSREHDLVPRLLSDVGVSDVVKSARSGFFRRT